MENEDKLYKGFRDLPASFLKCRNGDLWDSKNKEFKKIQIGPLECSAEEGNDC
jgi:hypothetical protein